MRSVTFRLTSPRPVRTDPPTIPPGVRRAVRFDLLAALAARAPSPEAVVAVGRLEVFVAAQRADLRSAGARIRARIAAGLETERGRLDAIFGELEERVRRGAAQVVRSLEAVRAARRSPVDASLAFVDEVVQDYLDGADWVVVDERASLEALATRALASVEQVVAVGLAGLERELADRRSRVEEGCAVEEVERGFPAARGLLYAQVGALALIERDVAARARGRASELTRAAPEAAWMVLQQMRGELRDAQELARPRADRSCLTPARAPARAAPR